MRDIGRGYHARRRVADVLAIIAFAVAAGYSCSLGEMHLMPRRALSIPLTLALALLPACGRNGPLTPWPGSPGGNVATGGGADLAAPPAVGDLGAPPDLARRPDRVWEWVNPAATANPLRAVGGVGANDLWLVGDVGTVLHWDGQRASVAYAGGPHDSFNSVAARAADDVWIGGATSAGSILHWDGSSWSTDYAIANRTIHSLTAGSKLVYATADDNGVGSVWAYAPGGGWAPVYDYLFYSTPILRDVIAFGDGYYGPLFTVGDGGTILWRNDTSFTRGTPGADGGADDPFGSDKDYFGVWGASPNDVWAAFVEGGAVGFTHWDGQTWAVEQRVQLGCTNGQKLTPADRGKRLVGLDANHILAAAGPTWCAPIAWNGSTWAPLSSKQLQPNVPSFTAAGGRWYAVTSDGQLEVSNNDDSWTSLPQPSRRDTLYQVAVSDDGVWSLGGRPYAQPLRWSDGAGWQQQPAPLPVKSNANVSTFDTWAIDANDVWMALTIDNQGAVSHWDGSAWSTPTVLPGSDRMTGIWADRDDDVWAVGGGDPADGWGLDSCRAYHFDGVRWTAVPLPMHPWGAVYPSVFGLRSDAVWISLHIWNTTHRFVWKWDGTSVQQVAYWPEDDTQSFGRPWASADDDVWIPAQPVIHWDGTAWSQVESPPDLDINAIYGTARDDVWAVGQGAFGGAIWHLVNGKLVVAVDVAPRLYGIGGSPHGLPWAVGDNGATLRLVDRAPIP